MKRSVLKDFVFMLPDGSLRVRRLHFGVLGFPPYYWVSLYKKIFGLEFLGEL